MFVRAFIVWYALSSQLDCTLHFPFKDENSNELPQSGNSLFAMVSSFLAISIGYLTYWCCGWFWKKYAGFRETLRADIDVGRFQRPESRSKNMNLILVSHGLTLRVFLMRWYKWTVQQFEGLYNFGNTEMLVMELGPGGR